jgi:hypothetical protein
MRANHAIAAIAFAGILTVAAILYTQPDALAPESGLGLDATASTPSGPKHIREAQMAPPGEQSKNEPAARNRGPASTEAAHAVGALRRPFRAPFKVLETLLTRDAPAGADGSHFRTQIVRTGFKYPLIRIEERVSADGRLLGEREMVADHVLVKLQDGATRGDLEDVLSRQTGSTVAIRRAAHTPGLFLVSFDGLDPTAMERVMRSLGSETHVIARTEPDLIVHAF